MSATSWARERRFNVPPLLPQRLRSLHTLGLVLTIVLVGWLGWVWYRSSSFVKVTQVTITGVNGPDVTQIRHALTESALGMTTLNMSISKLESSVEAYAYVQSITVSHHGAHSVSVDVTEQVPVALIQVGGQDQVVDSRDQILTTTTTIPHGELPQVPLRSVPATDSITGAGAKAAIAVLAAAPYALLSHIANATSSAQHGVVVQLRSGPQLYFGPTNQLRQKWTAVVAVLQNGDSANASYIDVSDPTSPAAGAPVSNKQAAALGLAPAIATNTHTTATTATTTTTQ